MQILPATGQRRKSFGQRLNEGVGQGLESLSEILKKKKQDETYSKLTGEDLSGLSEDQQENIASKLLQEKSRTSKFSEDLNLKNEKYEDIKDAFGEKFAKIWKASEPGAQTRLMDLAVNEWQYGNKVQDTLDRMNPDEKMDSENKNIPEQNLQDLEKPTPQLKNGKLPEDFKYPNYSNPPKGYSQKDWNMQRLGWRKENAPIFEEIKGKLKANTRDKLDIKKLSQLSKSKKLPEGFERLLINPESGEFYGLAQLTEMVSPEAQEWVKVISRFGNRAKDAFGSRVTNFDLVQYMKQFPGLLNTEEGRERIIKMMKINNELDSLYDDSLKAVYQKYGLSGIPQEEADRLAQDFVKDRTKQLSDEFLELEDENVMSDDDRLSGITVDVIGPDGQEYTIDQSQVSQLEEGYRLK